MNRRTILQLSTALITTIGAVALPGAVLAADAAAAASNATIEEVVVTAERFKSTVQTTPVAVSAFSPAMLAQRQVVSVQQMASQIPGLVITKATGTSTAARIVLRGAGQENSGINFDPGVGIYIDGVYQPRISGAFFDFFDIDRVEVLRGPQGTLYGRNSSGGAIKIETMRPSFDWKWGGDIAYGTYQTTDARALVSGPIIDNTLAFSLSGVSRKHGGFLDAPAYNRKVNAKDTQAARGKLLYTPTEKIDIVAAVDYQQDHSDMGIGVPLQAPAGVDTAHALGSATDLTRTDLFGPQANKLYSWGASLNGTYKVTDAISLVSITGYRNVRATQFGPLWPTLAAQNSGNGAQNLGSGLQFRDHSFSQEFNAVLQTDKIKAILGAYVFDEKGKGVALAPYATPNIQYRGTRAEAVFGQITYNIFDKLSISAGGRETREKANFTQFYYTLRTFSQSAQKTFKSFSPKVAINYQASDNALGYVSFTKGFKSGGFNPVSPTTNTGVVGVDGAPTPYGQENVNSYEAGVKFTTDDHKFRINAAVFEAKYKGLQLPVFFPGTSNSYTSNASNATIKGIELEPTWQPIDSLQIYAAMAFNHGKYTSSFKCAGANTVIVECSNRKIKGLVPTKIDAGFVFSPEMGVPGQFHFAADDSYNAAYFNNVANEGPLVQTPKAHIVNGSISWDTPDRHWTVILEGTNLFNKHYVLAGLQLANPVLPTVTGYPNDPRVVDIRLRAKF